MSEEKYFDSSKIIIRKINNSAAKEIIETYHYSHTFSLCRIAYGIFYITEKNSKFFDSKEELLIGCIVYSQPVGRLAAESISNLINIKEVFELTRLFIHDGFGKNIESYCISETLKMVKKDFPKLKAIISYADGEQGHKGTIYQASNFYYQGNSSLALMPNFSISLKGPPYEWIHSRTVSSTYGSHNVEHIKKRVGHTFWRKKESTKHRYVYLLGSKTEKKKILKNLKHPFLPYPKGNNYKDEIEMITVENPRENVFFG